MKSKYIIAATLSIITLGSAAFAGSPPGDRVIVHEWGTFTSVQGAEGELLQWKPLETPELPKFVYDWRRPAPGRRATGPYAPYTKGGFETLQRMETPVLFFYTDKEQRVDLSVRFPSGFITEWFPQAQQMGPSVASTNPIVTPNNMPIGETFSRESMIHWRDLRVIPATGHEKLAAKLPLDPTGNRYLTARETDSAYLQSATLKDDKDLFDYEKFLFYRGIGNFTTPLRVGMEASGAITLANNGTNTLPGMFVLWIKDKAGSFQAVHALKAGESMKIPVDRQGGYLPLPELQEKLATGMAGTLTEAGLYAREAKAMINTWKDSWFQEDGVRVLYLLPRAWTDQTLRLTMNPEPAELVRIMVGRAEVLTPEMEGALAGLLEKAKEGDADAGQRVRTMLRGLGRFAEPAFYRALAKVQPEGVGERRRLLALLTGADKPL